MVLLFRDEFGYLTLMKSQERAEGAAASKLISARIAELGDWRGELLATVR